MAIFAQEVFQQVTHVVGSPHPYTTLLNHRTAQSLQYVMRMVLDVL